MPQHLTETSHLAEAFQKTEATQRTEILHVADFGMAAVAEERFEAFLAFVIDLVALVE